MAPIRCCFDQTAVWHSDAARGPSTPSFNHLVGERQQLIGDFEAERLSSFAVKDEFEFVYLLNGQVSRFDALKNATDVNAAFVIAIPEHRSVAHQAANFDILSDFVERRNCVMRRKRDKVLAPAVEERVGSHKKRIGPLLN